MSLPVQDNFNQADDVLNNRFGWAVQTGENSLLISTNRVIPSDLGVVCSENYSGGETWPADQYVQCLITDLTGGTANGGQGIGVALRMDSAVQTYYGCVVNAAATNNVSLIKRVTGTATLIQRFTQAFTPGSDTLKVQVVGFDFTLYINGTSFGTVTDNTSAIASGRPGIRYAATMTTAGVDDWEAGAAAGGSSQPGPDFEDLTGAMVGM